MSSVAPESNERTQEQIQLVRHINSYLKKRSNQGLFRIGLAIESLSVVEIAEVVSGMLVAKEMDGNQWTDLAMQLPDVYASKVYAVARYCFKNSTKTTEKRKKNRQLENVRKDVRACLDEANDSNEKDGSGVPVEAYNAEISRNPGRAFSDGSQGPANDSDRSGKEMPSGGFYSYDEIIDRAACTQSAPGKKNTLMIGSIEFGDDSGTMVEPESRIMSDEIVAARPERSRLPKKGLVKVVSSRADKEKTLMSTPISQMSDSLRLSLTDVEEINTDQDELPEARRPAVEVVENNFNPKETVPSTPSGIAESQREAIRKKETVPSTVDSKRAVGLYPVGFQSCVDAEAVVNRGFESDPSSVKKIYDDRVLLKKYEGDPEIEVYLTDREDEDEIYAAIKEETGR
ncbi:hypothetical protein GF340_03155 [Candidatus Peregrinibacteria bacterium]|nr:hypothetical protein [Candidatus Peregrinibacteria bacterium]